MHPDTVKAIAELIGSLAWPITVISLAIVFKKQVGTLIQGIKGLRVGGIELELKLLKEKVGAVESATRNLSVDLYRVSGDALKVREEVWQYIAEILDKSSNATKFEMRKAMTEKHLPNIDLTIPQAKKILYHLGFLAAPDGEQGGFTEEITTGLLQAVYDFQQANDFDYADGIIGPKTGARLKQRSNLEGTSRQALPGGGEGASPDFLEK